MTRLHFVKSARKDNLEHGVKKGDSYYWWQFAFSPKQYSLTCPKRARWINMDTGRKTKTTGLKPTFSLSVKPEYRDTMKRADDYSKTVNHSVSWVIFKALDEYLSNVVKPDG